MYQSRPHGFGLSHGQISEPMPDSGTTGYVSRALQNPHFPIAEETRSSLMRIRCHSADSLAQQSEKEARLAWTPEMA